MEAGPEQAGRHGYGEQDGQSADIGAALPGQVGMPADDETAVEHPADERDAGCRGWPDPGRDAGGDQPVPGQGGGGMPGAAG
ncbi:MAG TPA: hypothetical protein DHU96_23455 [Actinobacteria bacterium]|nr:hypothetical protein [Actinomycetota bacterium]